MNYTYTHKITGKTVTVSLNVGDIIQVRDGVEIEIGQNDTARGIVGGSPDPKGWMPLPEGLVKMLGQRKEMGLVR